MLDKRKSLRRKMVLPVQVSIDKVTHLAHTIDITHTGARLWRPPNAISTRNDHIAARVEKGEVPNHMTRQVIPNEIQVGLKSLELQDNFWEAKGRKHQMDCLVQRI